MGQQFKYHISLIFLDNFIYPNLFYLSNISKLNISFSDTGNGLLSPQIDAPRFQSHPAHEEEEMQLPQEWTY